jgi:hypothetical protein
MFQVQPIQDLDMKYHVSPSKQAKKEVVLSSTVIDHIELQPNSLSSPNPVPLANNVENCVDYEEKVLQN